MIQQRFALLTFAICLLTLNVFAQKNTDIQLQVKEVKSTKQVQSKVITMHTSKKEVKPLFLQAIKPEVETQSKQATPPKRTPQPRFGSVSRPNIYKNLDTNIEALEQKITNLAADPNHDEYTLMKHRANLERLKEIQAERPAGY